MSAQTKLEQANALKKTIEQLAKKIDMTKRIIDWFINEQAAYPPIAMRCNPTKSTDMVLLDERYMPVEAQPFIAGYLKNMEEHLAQLQKDLETILN